MTRKIVRPEVQLSSPTARPCLLPLNQSGGKCRTAPEVKGGSSSFVLDIFLVWYSFISSRYWLQNNSSELFLISISFEYNFLLYGFLIISIYYFSSDFPFNAFDNDSTRKYWSSNLIVFSPWTFYPLSNHLWNKIQDKYLETPFNILVIPASCIISEGRSRRTIMTLWLHYRCSCIGRTIETAMAPQWLGFLPPETESQKFSRFSSDASSLRQR